MFSLTKEKIMEKIRNKAGRIVSYREKVYVNGKSRAKTFKRKSDALNWKKNFSSEIQRREALGIDHIESIDFESYFPQWLEMKQNQGMSIKTISEYESIIKNHLHPCVGKRQLEKITQVMAQEVIRKTKKQGLGSSRINAILAVFKQMLGDAVRLNHLIKNPLAGMKKIKREPRSLTYWLPDEIEHFLSENLDNPFYPLFVVALNTGMRRGELMGLCWDKVNLDQKWIEISRIRDRYGLRETTKTGKIRHIPLNKETWKVLKNLFEKRYHDDFVFTLSDGSLPDANHFSNRQFKNAIKKSGVRRIRFHDLRTTYASNFVMAGGDIFALSKLLGHTSVEMTAKKYAGLHPNFMKGVVETVQFSGNPK